MKTTFIKTRMVNSLFVPACLFIFFSVFSACSNNDDELGSAPAPIQTGTWTDTRDGQTYAWVQYGDQQWTTENLRHQPAQGEVVPDTTPVPSRYYDDGVARKYYDVFGFLYNYEAAENAIPTGWRLPTQADWDKLAANTNGNITDAINLQLGGLYTTNEVFQQLHDVSYYSYIYGYYWTADDDVTKTGANSAFCRKITYNKTGYEKMSITKTNYLSVRLVRDAR